MKMLGVKVNESTYRRFEIEREKQNLTKSEALREAITEYLQTQRQMTFRSDTPMILKESLRILKETKRRLDAPNLMGSGKEDLKHWLNRQIKSFQEKFEYEKRRI